LATRSTISLENYDGSVESIYCHNDGYPEHNGKILLNNYETEDEVRELIELGDISVLEPTIEETREHSYHYKGEARNIAYLNDIKELSKQSYNYLFRNDMWWMARPDTPWMQLDQIIMENKMEKFYPEINEVYGQEWMFLDIDDTLPTYLRREFRKIVRNISTELSEEGYREVEIEDYLKTLIEEIV
jgi:hypothetical protein